MIGKLTDYEAEWIPKRWNGAWKEMGCKTTRYKWHREGSNCTNLFCPEGNTIIHVNLSTYKRLIFKNNF